MYKRTQPFRRYENTERRPKYVTTLSAVCNGTCCPPALCTTPFTNFEWSLWIFLTSLLSYVIVRSFTQLDLQKEQPLPLHPVYNLLHLLSADPRLTYVSSRSLMWSLMICCVFVYVVWHNIRLNILFYNQTTCFDFQEVIIRTFKSIKPKITVLACTWDPSVTCAAGTVLKSDWKTRLNWINVRSIYI
jgi:hypothetical protein